MSNTDQKVSEDENDPLDGEFDYSHPRPNRFAARIPKNAKYVVLDPDVSAAYSSTEKLNSFLRGLSSFLKRSPEPLDYGGVSESVAAKPSTMVRYVPLDLDVAEVCSSTKELNDLLRAMIPILEKCREVVEHSVPAKVT